jgi:hypothetical protein
VVSAESDPRFLVNNPPCFTFETGIPSIPIPDGDIAEVLSAADRYNVNFLLLDSNTPPKIQHIFLGNLSPDRLQKVDEWVSPSGRFLLFQIKPGT